MWSVKAELDQTKWKEIKSSTLSYPVRFTDTNIDSTFAYVMQQFHAVESESSLVRLKINETKQANKLCPFYDSHISQ